MKDIDDLEHILRSTFKQGALSDLGTLAIPWESVVGETLARHCRPRRLMHGILFISASSPAWAHQLGFFKEEIRNKINTYLNRKAIREVRFDGRGFEGASLPEHRVIDVELTQDEAEAISHTVAEVPDEGIRAELTKLMELHIRRRKMGHDESDSEESEAPKRS